MCGINGGYGVKQATVEKMVAATTHRGTDATGVQAFGSVVFGHNRLAIIDLLARSNQPMFSPDKRHLLVFNGEIYNFQEIKKELPQWNFLTSGDTEVLLASLVTWGLEALDKFHGIFAFAWYDSAEGRLILARDQIGVKPLYYSCQSNSFLFSSELAGMLAGTSLRNLGTDALSHYFGGNNVPSPLTLVNGINKLPAGHFLKFDGKEVVIKKYYTPTRPSRSTLTGSEIRSVIGSTVEQQLISDRPVGIFLSGGLDSSIVLHHAASVGSIRTFSTSFEMVSGNETQFDKYNADSVNAKKTSEMYGCSHTDIKISLEQIRNNLLSFLPRLDEPVPNAVTTSQLFLNQAVRDQGIVIALGGDGGDELWGGYSRHRAVLAAQWFQSLPNIAQSTLALIHPKIKRLCTPLGATLHESLTILPASKFNFLLKIKLSNEPSRKILNERYNAPEHLGLSAIDAFMRVDRGLWLVEDALLRSDRTSMAAGVEMRVPLLGQPIVELADSLYGVKKFTPWQNKKILRDAYKNYLPDHLFTQPKRGWMAPGATWFRDPVIGAKIREVCSDSYYDGLSSLVDWSLVQKLIDDHVENRTYALNPLWNLLQLQVWSRHNNITF